MMASTEIEFSILGLMSLFGLVQSVYILVYIFFRSNNLARAVLPVLFFLTISAAFFITLANDYWEISWYTFKTTSLFFWTMCAPLSCLLIIQTARITKPPPLFFWPILILVPAVFGFLAFANNQNEFIDLSWFYVSSIIIGALSLLIVWFKRDSMDKLHKRKYGKERFWLIICFIVLNIALIATSFIDLGAGEASTNFDMIRIIIGISFIYIASTSLFRVYPPAVTVSENKEEKKTQLSDKDIEIALEVENLLHVQNVYQEPNYGRSDMAKELNVTESQLSRIVNAYFQQTVPYLLNSLRVEEAKTLLVQTKEDISLISEESGFNSIATFNRVFKDLVNISPKEYRKKYQ